MFLTSIVSSLIQDLGAYSKHANKPSTALDEVVTRLMEQNQGARPVPAPDDMIEKLPRTKITPGREWIVV